MDIWDLLSPNYISDFFTGWYTEWWAQALMYLFLSLPAILFLLVVLTKRLNRHDDTKDVLYRAKKYRLLILVHKSYKVCEKRKTCYIWMIVGFLILFFNTAYGVCYFLLDNDPNTITTGSLQTLSYLDFEIARQFLSRYIALSLSLMLVSLSFCMLFLERGLMAIKRIPMPMLQVDSYSIGENSLNETIIDSSEELESLVFHVTTLGDKDINKEGKNPSLLVFEYKDDCNDSSSPSIQQLFAWCVTVYSVSNEQLNIEQPSVYMDGGVLGLDNPHKLESFHLLRWETYANDGKKIDVTLKVIVR